ncbi:MAG: efflux transporter periplasmic adaptor subunit, partial [Deltaproteobacteria bacterium]|nr:efflux transporter periplasmic adaptor subunit [Deltaproteobacteria bacterium]
IAVGQPAEFKVDAYPERLFAGRVQQIRNAPQVVQNVVTYDVVISADNKNFKLKPGMTANVTIIITKKPGVLRAPNAALRFRPAEADNIDPCKNCLWIIKNGNPASIELETGIDDYSYTEIISGDISEGLEVITGCITK